jgi:hypothetical protein
MKILKKLGIGRTIAVKIITYPIDEENVQCSSSVWNEVCKNSFQSTHQSTTTSTTNATSAREIITKQNVKLL